MEVDPLPQHPRIRTMAPAPTLAPAVLLWASIALASDAPPDMLWPMPLRPAISSNFCEYREGHLHAGLDIRTFGSEGVPCRSSGDGYVSRIRASASAYGKALYVQLETGETLVYAHLAEFAPELEVIVREEQERRRRYRVDLRMPPSRYPVSRGDVIAWSGMTGATAPHLHFEVRNEQEHPLNPFSNGFSVTDPMPPEFLSLLFMPLDSDGRVDGECMPLEIAPDLEEGGYVVADTVVLSGSAGVAVNVIDRLNGESGRLAPHSVELFVDGGRVARITLDRFSFGNTSQVDFLYEIGRVRTSKDYYVQLFRRTGETLWDREFENGGRLTAGLEPGTVHEARITALDRAGNRANLTFFFMVASAGDAPVRARRGSPVSSGARLPGWYFFEHMVAVSPRASQYPMDQWRRTLSVDIDRPLALRASELSAVPVELKSGDAYAAAAVYLVGIVEGENRSIRFADLDIELVIGERTLFQDQAIYATRWLPDRPEIVRHELIAASKPARIGPYSMTLRADMEIRFITGDDDSTLAIYRLNEKKGEWVYYETVVSNGVVSTLAKRPGVYSVLRDRYPPAIRRPFVRPRKSYAGGPIANELVVPMEDAGSGLDDERSAIYIAGNPQIARWDFMAKKMFIELRDPNIMGPQSVSVVSYDMIGNRSQLDVIVEFPPNR